MPAPVVLHRLLGPTRPRPLPAAARHRAHRLLALLLSAAPPLGPLLAAPSPVAADTRRLERSWQDLDRQLRQLDQLLPEPAPAAAPLAPGAEPTPRLPQRLLAPNAAPTGPLQPAQALPPPPLALPTAAQLSGEGVRSLSLRQTLALGFAHSPTLQARREEVAASLAELQARLGSWWPRLLAFANGGSSGSSTTVVAPVGTAGLGFGPLYAPGGSFYVPDGGRLFLNQSSNAVQAGLALNYDVLDFARQPRVQQARAQLRQARQAYANAVRQLQLELSEAYYQLQQADQTVLIREALLRNDLLILEDVLDLKRAGLVPRLDLLRRQALEAADQERLIQALSDRAVARRRLATLLNLPPGLSPSAGDPITLQPSWPLDLEQSLLAAYRGNPELETILAAREALARQETATAAALLPKLSLFANAGASTGNTVSFGPVLFDGGCCGASLLPLQTSTGTAWSLGLTLSWLLFDAGTTAAEVRAIARRRDAISQDYAARRNDIRLRLEQAFFQHEASLARLVSARRGVEAAREAFRDDRLRYRAGLANELNLSSTQTLLIESLLSRLNATLAVNITYARLLRELLPAPRDPAQPFEAPLRLEELPPARP
ncbi:MAG: TolC family protein [Synechococcaceae cyanobacterium]|nr:TolC family protein [Synechococcaceae cyanobacterium]